MECRKGYSAEATTLTRLWLDNSEQEHRFTQAVIEEAFRNRDTREERVCMLAGRLEDYVRLHAPEIGPNVWGDLFELALSSIDFITIARMYVDDWEDWQREGVRSKGVSRDLPVTRTKKGGLFSAFLLSSGRSFQRASSQVWAHSVSNLSAESSPDYSHRGLSLPPCAACRGDASFPLLPLPLPWQA